VFDEKLRFGRILVAVSLVVRFISNSDEQLLARGLLSSLPAAHLLLTTERLIQLPKEKLLCAT
jgi:hypothetical protein